MRAHWHIYMGGLYLILGSFFLLVGGLLVRIDVQIQRFLLRSGDKRSSRLIMRLIFLLLEGTLIIFGILFWISNFINP